MLPLRNEGLTKSFTATAAILKNRIVKQASLTTCTVAGASTDALIGVSGNVDVDSGAVCDVIFEGVALLLYGGTIALGDPVTATTAGKGIAATVTAAATGRVIGNALVAGIDGDIGSVHIQKSRLTVPAA
jgi:hypothetical protein